MDIGSGLGPMNMQSGIQQAQENRMIQGANSPVSASDTQKIDKGSKEFEAVLLGSWLQQAEQSFATVPGADEDQDAGGGQMMSLGVQSLATSMAASGGLGISKMIAKAMHSNAEKANALAESAGKLDAPGTK
jgi:Rod binding domain-containing protein